MHLRVENRGLFLALDDRLVMNALAGLAIVAIFYFVEEIRNTCHGRQELKCLKGLEPSTNDIDRIGIAMSVGN